MAGGSLVSKLRKGFGEVLAAELASGRPPRLFGGQAEGCAPIVRHFDRNDDRIIPEVPNTIARSIAIGNPADGVFAAKAMRESGGAAQAVSDEALVTGIRLLAETTGIFTETAGGVPVAVLLVALYTTIPLLLFVRWRGWPFYPGAAFRLLVVRAVLYAQLLLPFAAAAAVIGMLIGIPLGHSLLYGRLLLEAVVGGA